MPSDEHCHQVVSQLLAADLITPVTTMTTHTPTQRTDQPWPGALKWLILVPVARRLPLRLACLPLAKQYLLYCPLFLYMYACETTLTMPTRSVKLTDWPHLKTPPCVPSLIHATHTCMHASDTLTMPTRSVGWTGQPRLGTPPRIPRPPPQPMPYTWQ